MHAAAVPLLASLLCYVVAAAAVTEEPLHTLKKSCQFTLGNRRFDLCPVFEGNEGGWSVAYDRQTPPTVTKTEYKISFAGALKKSKKVPSHEQVRQVLSIGSDLPVFYGDCCVRWVLVQVCLLTFWIRWMFHRSAEIALNGEKFICRIWQAKPSVYAQSSKGDCSLPVTLSNNCCFTCTHANIAM